LRNIEGLGVIKKFRHLRILIVLEESIGRLEWDIVEDQGVNRYKECCG